MAYVTSEVVPQTQQARHLGQTPQSNMPVGGAFQTAKDLLASAVELRSRIERAASAVSGSRPMDTAKNQVPEDETLSHILEETFRMLREAHEEVSRLYNGLGI